MRGAVHHGGRRPANYIAKWNGSSWSALGSGMNHFVNVLAVSGSDLYAGGDFTMAGGKLSTFLARASLEWPSLSILRSGSAATVSWPASFGRWILQQSPDVTNTSSWSSPNYPLTTNGTTKSATVHLTPTNQFFRLIDN